jgi:cytochrome P450
MSTLAAATGADLRSRVVFAAAYRPTRHLRSNLIPFFARCQRDFGDVVRFPYGRRGYVIVSEPELVDEILVGDAANFPRGAPYKAWRRSQRKDGYNALGPYGDRDRFLATRRVVQRAFSPSRANGLWSWFREVADERLLGAVEERTDVDLVEALRPGALALTFEATLGDVGVPPEQLGRWYGEGYHYMRKKPSKRFVVADNLRLPSKVRAVDAIAGLRRTAAHGIEHADPAQEALLDVLHELVHTGELTHEDAMWQAVSILMTANHGNVGALAWTLYRLAAHPAALAALRDELEQRPDATGLDELPYLRAVVDESFRRHPTISGITREAVQERRYLGVTVRPGDVVEICPYILHNDPRWWSDADAFVPERWLDGRDAGRPKQSFIPFGAGMRKCVAYPLVQTVVGACVASLVGAYDLRVRRAPRSRYDSMPVGMRVDLVRR